MQLCNEARFNLRTLLWLGLWVVVALMLGVVAGVCRWPLVHDVPVVLWLPIGLLVAVLIGLSLWDLWNDREGLRGILVITAAIAAVTASALALLRPRDTWLWLQVLFVVVLVAIALVAIAPEWTRRWLLASTVILTALVGGIVVRAGYQDSAHRQLTEAIDSAISDRAGLLQQLEDKDTTKTPEEIDKEKAAAIKDLEQRINDVSSSDNLSNAGVLLIADLGTEAMNTSLNRLLLVPADGSGVQPDLVAALRTSARAAVDAYEAKATDLTTPDLDAATLIACQVVAELGVEPPSCAAVVLGQPSPTTALSDPADALHRLALEVAAYRVKVTGADADKAALVALAGAEPSKLEISLVDAITAGPETVLASTGDNPLRLVPGPAGWALIGVLLVFGLRQLLRINSAQLAGPVKVDYSGDDAAHLRVAVLSNLDAPGTAPGTSATQSITDLAGLVEATTLFGKALAVISGALAPPQGYAVNAEVASPAAADDATTVPPLPAGVASGANTAPVAAPSAQPSPTAPTTVLVRITSVTGNTTLDSARFDSPDPLEALQSAGFWAAGTLLARSTRIPTWAAWNQQTAEALATASALAPTLLQLEAAVQAAPNSGILLLKLANELQLKGDEFAALVLYARCVEAHPRYHAARYRLGVSIGMFARDLAGNWNNLAGADQLIAIDGLRRAADRVGLDSPVIAAIGTLGAAGSTVTDWWYVARAFLQRGVDDLRPSATLVGVLRRSERDLVRRPHRSDPDARYRRWRLRALTRSAILAYPPPGGNSAVAVTAVENDIRDRRAGWQLLYNDACQKAAASPSEALRSLERCLALPRSGELTRAWAEADPDLKVLAGHPRFVRFLDQLGSAQP